MSSCLNTNNVDHLDKQTHIIVDGYFHQSHKLLSSPFTNIPSDIVFITLLYVDDHFMFHRGSYQWNINEDTIKHMKDASGKKMFLSPTFEIGKLKWYGITKRDKENKTNFGVYVRLRTLPVLWRSIVVSIYIRCVETGSGNISIGNFESSKRGFGFTNLISFQDLNTKKLTVITSINVLKITLTKDNEILFDNTPDIAHVTAKRQFKWNINSNLLQQMKNARSREFFVSPIYYNLWYLRIQPNFDNDVYVQLCMCSFPVNADKVSIKWTIRCNEIGLTKSYNNPFDEEGDCWGWGTNHISFEEFQALDTFTIHISVGDETEELAMSEWHKYTNNETSISNDDMNNDSNTGIKLLWNEMKAQNELLSDIKDIMKRQNEFLFNKMELIMNTMTGNNGNRVVNELEGIDDEIDTMLIDIELSDKQNVEKWLKRIHLYEYYEMFIQNGFDNLESISYITINDLIQIGVDKIGHQRKIIKNAEKIA